MKKSKILKLDLGQYGYSMYASNGFAYAHCSNINKGVIKQLSGFGSCREGFTNRIFEDINRKNRRLSNKRLRCLVRTVSSGSYDDREKLFEKQTEAGLKILNILEDHYNWPLTKMFSVASVSSKPMSGYQPRKSFMKLLVGSSKWLRSPHITSLFLLLFRLPTKRIGFSKVKSYKQLMELCRQFAGLPKPGSKDAPKRVGGDRYHVLKTMQFWDPLMANLNKMFKGMTSKNNFDRGNYERYYYDEGISKLCKFNCNNPQINKRFVALAKDADIEMPARISKKW